MALLMMEGFDWLPGNIYNNIDPANLSRSSLPASAFGSLASRANPVNANTAKIGIFPSWVNQAAIPVAGQGILMCPGNKDTGKGIYFFNSQAAATNQNPGAPANTAPWEWGTIISGSTPYYGLQTSAAGFSFRVDLPDFGDKLVFGFAWRKDFTNSQWTYPIFMLTGALPTQATVGLHDRGMSITQTATYHRNPSSLVKGGGIEFKFINGDIPAQIDGGLYGQSVQTTRWTNTTSAATVGTAGLTRWNATPSIALEGASDLKYGLWNYIECVVDWANKKTQLYINNVFQTEIAITATVKPTILAFGPHIPGPSSANTYDTCQANWGLDDLYILDGTGAAPLNDRLGVMKIYTEFPTTDSDVSFVRPVSSATSNWSQVNSITDPITNAYLTVNEVDAYDLYTSNTASVVPVGKPIYAASVGLMYQKTGPDSVQMAPIMKHTTDPTLRGQTISLNAISTYGTGESFFPLNPATGKAWTRNELIATAFGAVAV